MQIRPTRRSIPMNFLHFINEAGLLSITDYYEFDYNGESGLMCITQNQDRSRILVYDQERCFNYCAKKGIDTKSAFDIHLHNKRIPNANQPL